MCAIAGIVHKSDAPVSAVELDRAVDLAAHRGPDGRGTFRSRNLGLGHRRLAIVDLSDDGLQPMHYAEGLLTLTFNGEIYNYLELRKELSARGVSFRTQTDSEVILAAYSEWGADCVSRFNGMWAFAIYDAARNQIFLSRDRFGVKPLFFIDEPGTFAFASEIGQLLPLLGPRPTDLDRVRCFLLTGGLDLDNHTFFGGISKLPAGSSAIYDLVSHRLSIQSYYSLRARPDFQSLDDHDALKLFACTLEDSVKLRLRSDVLVGTCLSGGLDSSSIATLASNLVGSKGPTSFNAITAISEDKTTDETPFARSVVEHSHLDWVRVKPSYQDFTDSLPSIVVAQQEPFGGPSLTMQYFVMKAARENGIKVLLDGQGGDETLLGYEKYYYTYLRQLLRDAGWSGVFAGIASLRVANGRLGISGLAKYVLGARFSTLRAFGHWREQPYLSGITRSPAHITDFARRANEPFRLQTLEIESTNLPVLLRYEDRNSMHHGVEARLPFLDYRLVELSLSLPVRQKIRNGWTKWILRRAMDGRMPAEVVWRRNKYSFNAPDNIWLRKHSGEMKDQISNSSLIEAVTRRDALIEGFDRLPLSSQWRLYSIALWQQAFGISV